MKFFKSLRGQLTAAIGTVLALGLGLLLIVAGHQMSQMTMEAFIHEQQVTALVLANTVPESLEVPQVQSLLSAWTTPRDRQHDGFAPDTHISLFGAGGSRIASSAGSVSVGAVGELRGALSGQIVSDIVRGRLYTAVPVTHDGRSILGVLQVDSSLDSVQDRLLERWIALIGATIAALFLAFAIALWLARQLTRPLAELQGVAQQMSEGQLDARVELDDTINELASLGTMFNHMAGRIESMMQEQRDFVANASHELRSPLAAMKLRAEALACEMVKGNRARQYATEINDEVSQLAQLVNDLLQLSRAESGAFTPPEQPVGVMDELQSCIRTAQPRLALRQQRLETQIAEDIPDVYIHPQDLGLMVGNLLDNASKYSPDGATINLSATWNSQRLEIAIRDRGEGIPPEDLPRISERFFRVDRAHTRNIPGVGLGLALVSAVARQYSGILRIESSGIPGEGTLAYLELPVRAAEPWCLDTNQNMMQAR
ncbi:MAG: HAMP domain-containing histidine kinase [Herpetosiphonaceae bacterium]|nr:HAMP domain-containing histidine kinase [Herpetosiphonaceae bacterium]